MKTLEDFKIILEIQLNLEESQKWIRLEERNEQDKAVDNDFVKPLINKDNSDWMEIEDKLSNIRTAHRSEGFINGFIYAMQLQKECLI